MNMHRYALWIAILILPLELIAGSITPSINNPLEFKATASGSFGFLGEETVDILGPNWRFTMRFYSKGSFLGIDPFVFEHNSFPEEGQTTHINAASFYYSYGAPDQVFNFLFERDEAHPLSTHTDHFKVYGLITYDGGNQFTWYGFIEATHNSNGAHNLDTDGDGVLDSEDQCPSTAPGELVNASGCSIEDLCPCEKEWKNHAEYVQCVTHEANQFVQAGIITNAEKGRVLQNAARSDCGGK